MEINYLPLFVIFLTAWLVPMLLSWGNISKLPSIVVEIAMGVVMGPFVLGLVSGEEDYLIFLSHTGFLFLIFLSGLALDIKKIAASIPRGRIRKIDVMSNTFLLALSIYLGSLLISLPIVYFIPIFHEIDKFFVIIMLTSVALSVVVPVIKSDAEIKRKFGQIILLEGAIATIMTILLIAVYAGIYKGDGFELKLLLFLVIFIAFFIAYRIGKLLVKIKLFQRLLYQLEHASSQIRIRGSIALLLLFIIIAKEINTEPVLGAFFAGMLLSIFLPKELSAPVFKLESMGYGFFIPIFFIMVGVNLDIASLQNFTTSLNLIVILTGAFYVVQVIPSVLLIKLFGLKKSLSAGTLLTARFGLTIAVAQIGLSLGIISTAANTGIVTACIITCVLSPALYKYLNSKMDHYRDIYIIGGGKTSLELATRLKLHGVSYRVITSQKTDYNSLHTMGIDVLLTDEGDIETYRRRIKIRTIDNIVVLMGSDEENVRVTNMLNKQLGHSRILTVIDKSHLVNEHDIANVQVIDIRQIIAAYLENEIMRPETMHALMDSFGAYSVEEILVVNKEINGRYIRDIPLPQAGSLVVIRRGKEMFIPHGDTRLLQGDLVTAIGNTSALIKFRELL